MADASEELGVHHHDHGHDHDHDHDHGHGHDHETDLEPTGQAPLWRRLLTEFIGTLLLVGVGTGAATALLVGPLQRIDRLTTAIPQLKESAGDLAFAQAFLGTQPAIAGELLPVALAFTLILAVLVYAFGGTSGGHFNPAVTAALAVVRRFRFVDVIPYWIAQVVGGIAGAFVVAQIYKDVIGGKEVLFGATTVAGGVNVWQGMLAEALIGFILMTAVMAVAIDPRSPKGWSGLVIGLGLGAGILVTGAATGGSANFARSLGPFVAALVHGADKIPWSDLIVYAGGPLIGAAAAALVYESATGLEPATPAPRPGAATTTDTDGVTIEIGEPDGATDASDSFAAPREGDREL